MKFPVVIRQRKAEAVIYAKSGKYPYYRVAYRIAGKRIVRSFQKFSDARQEAETKAREISAGNQSLARSSREATEALAIRAALDEYCRTTGRRFSAAQAVTGFLDALRLLPPERNLVDAVRGYLGTVAVVRRKPLAEAVAEFCDARKAMTIAAPGKRPALNPVYAADTARRLKEFADAFSGTSVAELEKDHLNSFVTVHGHLSAKSRNHLRTTLRMFLGWCVRRDYLPTTHRLFATDGLRKEPNDAAPIDFYRPKELRALLEAASGPMRAVIALQALAGLRLQEALRLDWGEVFDIADHIEISTAKSKTRQRRLIEICPALNEWLTPCRGLNGKVSNQTLNAHTQSFIALRRGLKIPSRRNGLRHGIVTYHFALHQNENTTSALAGNSPAMIHAHYKGLAAKSDAEKWFTTRPVSVA